MHATLLLIATLSQADAGPRNRLFRSSKEPCATEAQLQLLDAKVAELTTRLASLEQQQSQLAGPTPAQEAAAAELVAEITRLATEGNMTGAKARADQLEAEFGATLAYADARKLLAELAVIGQRVPSGWSGSISRWFQGESNVNLGEGTSLLVFWELWCPHCRREVPVLKATHERFSSKGLNVVGLTRVTRSATVESVQSFLKEQAIQYPVAQETGDLSRAFNVSGIPAAAVVQDGVVIWRGHPARLTDSLLSTLLRPAEGAEVAPDL